MGPKVTKRKLPEAEEEVYQNKDKEQQIIKPAKRPRSDVKEKLVDTKEEENEDEEEVNVDEEEKEKEDDEEEKEEEREGRSLDDEEDDDSGFRKRKSTQKKSKKERTTVRKSPPPSSKQAKKAPSKPSGQRTRTKNKKIQSSAAVPGVPIAMIPCTSSLSHFISLPPRLSLMIFYQTLSNSIFLIIYPFNSSITH